MGDRPTLRLNALLLIAGASAATAAGPTDPQPAAIQHLNRGHELYNQGQLEPALVEFKLARDLVPERATPYRWLGMTEAALGRCADAVGHLETFLTKAQPGDPRIAEVRALHDHCQRQLAPDVGTLVVESRPDGADVHLDDEPAALGRTPYRQEGVAVGPHVVVLRRDGHVAARRELQVSRGETFRLAVELQPLAVAVAPPPRVPLYRRWPLWLGVGASAALGVAAAVIAAIAWPPTVTVFPPHATGGASP
jgi:hypothetical protein